MAFCYFRGEEMAYPKRARNVGYWDGYADWYQLWLDHNDYHKAVLEALERTVAPGWRVLDVGGGGGALALPLARMGCSVTLLEPSDGMRALFERIRRTAGEVICVDGRRWEHVPRDECEGYDLILACNSIHLMEGGPARSLRKIFDAGPAHVFVVSEEGLNGTSAKVPQNYRLSWVECAETESSFAYHRIDEALAHWAFKWGRLPSQEELSALFDSLTVDRGHFCLLGRAKVGMYWWDKIR